MSAEPIVVVRSSHALLVGYTLVNVAMQLGSALLLKTAPEATIENLVWIVAVLAGVLGLNVTRLIVWNSVHKRYPISIAYPASALFFPGILAMAWWFGEPVGMPQLVGAGLVLVGVLLLVTRKESHDEH